MSRDGLTDKLVKQVVDDCRCERGVKKPGLQHGVSVIAKKRVNKRLDEGSHVQSDEQLQVDLKKRGKDVRSSQAESVKYLDEISGEYNGEELVETVKKVGRKHCGGSSDEDHDEEKDRRPKNKSRKCNGRSKTLEAVTVLDDRRCERGVKEPGLQHGVSVFPKKRVHKRLGKGSHVQSDEQLQVDLKKRRQDVRSSQAESVKYLDEISGEYNGEELVETVKNVGRKHYGGSSDEDHDKEKGRKPKKKSQKCNEFSENLKRELDERDSASSTEDSTPPPEIQLTEMKNINPTKIEWSEATKDPVDVLLVTLNEIEFRAAYQILSEPKSADSSGEFAIVYFGRIGSNKVALIRSPMGADGKTCLDMINELRAKTIISAGVCFGMKKSKQKLGDVVVSTKLACYYPSRVNRDGSYDHREKVLECKPRIQRLFCHLKAGWNSASQNGAVPDVHCGLMISGSKLIDCKDFKEKLQSHYRNALGGEMEGAGLHLVCEKYGRPWMVCKAISYWGDGSKNKEWQPFAAVVAASYVKHVLEMTYVPGNGGNGPTEETSPAAHTDRKRFLVRDLEKDVRSRVCQLLNEESVVKRDFRGLAAKMEFKDEEIEEIGKCTNPTENLLKEWGTQEDFTVDNMIKLLREMKRDDVVKVIGSRQAFVC